MKNRFYAPVLAGVALILMTIGSFAAQLSAPVDVAGLHFKAIVVDTSRYQASGAGSYADVVKASVLDQALKVFADRLDPRDTKGATLVIRIDSVMWTNGGGAYGHHGTSSFSVTPTDYMEGAGIIMRNGHVILEHPMLAAHESDGGYGRPRADALSNYYVLWLKKEMGL
eukprot:gene13676-13792_t